MSTFSNTMYFYNDFGGSCTIVIANLVKIVNTDMMDEEPRLKRKPTTSSARPRRLSEVDIHDTKKPIPEASSLFIFSKTNRLGTAPADL